MKEVHRSTRMQQRPHISSWHNRARDRQRERERESGGEWGRGRIESQNVALNFQDLLRAGLQKFPKVGNEARCQRQLKICLFWVEDEGRVQKIPISSTGGVHPVKIDQKLQFIPLGISRGQICRLTLNKDNAPAILKSILFHLLEET